MWINFSAGPCDLWFMHIYSIQVTRIGSFLRNIYILSCLNFKLWIPLLWKPFWTSQQFFNTWKLSLWQTMIPKSFSWAVPLYKIIIARSSKKGCYYISFVEFPLNSLCILGLAAIKTRTVVNRIYDTVAYRRSFRLTLKGHRAPTLRDTSIWCFSRRFYINVSESAPFSSNIIQSSYLLEIFIISQIDRRGMISVEMCIQEA